MSNKKPDKLDSFHDPATAALFAASKTGLFPQPKTSIFRYVGMRGDDPWSRLESTIFDNVLPLTVATSLNDPFEANPVIIDDVVSDDLQDFINRFAATNAGTKAGLAFMIEIPGIRGISPIQKTKIFEEKLRTYIRSFISSRNEHCYIGSFSRRISSELQWSHYADGYKGLAYHFVTTPQPDSGFRFLKSVKYSKQRPAILVSEILEQLMLPMSDQTLRWLSYEQRSFLTKSTEWEYEEEERIIKQNVKSMTFLPVELVSLVVGPRFPDESISKLKSICSKRSRPVRIFRARPSPTSYAVEVDWSAEI